MAGKKPREFNPRLIKDDDIYGKDGYALRQLRPEVFEFDSKFIGSNVYLVLGDTHNVLIDSGIVSKFQSFNYLLTTEIGLKLEEISLIIATHEHFDHISNNCFYKCPILAHRAAATKIQNSDELITKAKKWSVDMSDFHIDIWLENRTVIDLGNVVLQVIETPGHTSGSICLLEMNHRYAFTGDTVFKGALSNIYESGSISELITSLQSLQALRISAFFPGHGPCVFGESAVQDEITLSLQKAKESLTDFIERVSCRPLEKSRPPPSLYNREADDL